MPKPQDQYFVFVIDPAEDEIVVRQLTRDELTRFLKDEGLRFDFAKAIPNVGSADEKVQDMGRMPNHPGRPACLIIKGQIVAPEIKTSISGLE